MEGEQWDEMMEGVEEVDWALWGEVWMKGEISWWGWAGMMEMVQGGERIWCGEGMMEMV